MKSNIFRAFGAALLIGSAGLAMAGAIAPTTALAATVRPAVGNALRAAISLAGSGNASAAMAKVHEAEAVPSLTPGEQSAIAQTRAYVEAKAGGGSGSNKFVNDYNAGRYRDAIADAEALRKGGGLSFQNQVVLAQAYYLSGDYSSAVRYLKGLGSSTQVLKLLASAAYKAGDSETMRATLEQLVQQTGDPTYWKDLLTSASNARGLNDHQTLDLYRLRFQAGAMKDAEDYSLLAQMSLQFGVAGAAQAAEQAGVKAGVLSGDREQRLEALTAKQIAADQANFAKAEAAAAKAPNGEPYVKLGESYWGYGKYQDAVRCIQAGIAKGVTDKDNAQMRLGQAYLGLGQRDQAIKAFESVSKTNTNGAMVARLWILYARSAKK